MKSLSNQIKIATTNHRGRTVFTYEYGYYLERYSWGAKAFIAHCISRWDDEFEHVLDYWEEGHNPIEIEVVKYWGPRFAERFKNEFPQCDANWCRDVFRAKLRSLVLPKKLIEEYFEKLGFNDFFWEPERKEYAEQYLKRFNPYFGADIKPLPTDWLNIGCDGGVKGLKLSDDILLLAKNMDINRLVNIISWLLSGFIKHYDILCTVYGDSLILNSALCNAISKQYPDYSGTGSLNGKWFEGIYRAKLLSIRIPERLLKIVFSPIRTY
ncbi:MAG: hypothetical protein HY279_13890 [Nitrospinae bacterium]|nr:hypothetical protein [Nitrospinota bacterium]